ncbi:uncharacterized protein LAJ45_04697 [Morchella importuna]|uniref:DUF1688-domain-containing protein n=1 Tax=Morchella conica CCBAS932 TaxID=1392247 RepID=A0A3N4KGG0_9PEZI|nr:uncharacterized protein LAJ45_04697 [Morchella importuna]KAH8150996.1 hypothetical protein LAJ45_04697 [Morchella importuna]RPB08412.1 DUF1688-domain-containing protein [Morchella conica CCBAS932]
MGLFSKKNGSRANSVTSDSTGSKPGRKGSQTSLASTIRSPTTGQPGRSSSSGNASPPLPAIPSIELPPAPDPGMDPSGYLRSIYAVRERSKFVIEAALKNQLTNFTVDMEKFKDVAEYVVSIIKRDYAPDYHTIPPHGRWQHFEVGGRPRIDQLIKSWPSSVDTAEQTRRLIDLFLVSVLLDAGAGTKWQYKSQDNGKIYRRSEGLAVASLDMFKEGLFSSNPEQKEQVDGMALKGLTVEILARGLQISDSNPMDGLEGRSSLLIKLGEALDNQDFFGVDSRPGNMLDYLLQHSTTQKFGVTPVIPIPTLWNVLMEGLAPIWPQSRTQFDGVSLGDAWPCSSMPPAPGWERIVPFHKLTQWLTYSLMVPMSKLMGVMWAGEHLLTGLPEYRNGGLLIDTGLLTLKQPQMERGIQAYHANAKKAGQPNVEVVPLFGPEDDVIIEWRACTLGFLDMLLGEVNNLLDLRNGDQLTLAQMLEAGTWKGGRELAEVSRPNTKEPPIMILSDGTVF